MNVVYKPGVVRSLYLTDVTDTAVPHVVLGHQVLTDRADAHMYLGAHQGGARRPSAATPSL